MSNETSNIETQEKYIKEFQDLFSTQNLFKAHKKAKKWKNIKMLWKFEDNLFQNIALIRALVLKSRFEFWPYRFFEVVDRKKRLIVSSPYKDRIIHWVLYEYMYDIFAKSFIYDTFWNIKWKWTNLWLKRTVYFFRKKENNYILKLDFSKYFFSVYHEILLEELLKKIENPYILKLLEKLVFSFKSPDIYNHIFSKTDTYMQTKDKWMPIWNLTSQLFANIYLNRLDHFAKDYLKIKYYLRYVDDVVIFCKNKDERNDYKNKICNFVSDNLKLTLNPKKLSIFPKNKTLDFLGYRISNYSVLPRKATQRKIRKSILSNDLPRLTSYNWVLKDSDSYLKIFVKNL